MNTALILFAVAAVALRLFSVFISRRHESVLKREGAVEMGAANSKLLTLAHILFYLAAIVEGAVHPSEPDLATLAGLVLYLAGMAMLVVVIRLLGRFWTVKLLIASDHALVVHPLFRLVRHPNYFLNILPELIGLALVFHAYATLIVGLPLYLVPLITRIREEERAMRETFAGY